MKHLRVVLALVLSLCGGTASPCSMRFDRVDRLDPSEFVFRGHVVEIEAPQGDDASMRAAVVVVAPEEIISANLDHAQVRVAVFYTQPDCRLRPAEFDTLKTAFPVGSLVAVIARRATDGSHVLAVRVGGDTEIAAVGNAPSQRFEVRQALALLAQEPRESARMSILQDLIPNSSRDLDFEGAVNHYIPSERPRAELLASYQAYWPHPGQ